MKAPRASLCGLRERRARVRAALTIAGVAVKYSCSTLMVTFSSGTHHSPDGSLIAAVTECDKPGFVLRALGNRTEELHALVLATANLVRSQLRGQGKIHLRKY